MKGKQTWPTKHRIVLNRCLCTICSFLRVTQLLGQTGTGAWHPPGAGAPERAHHRPELPLKSGAQGTERQASSLAPAGIWPLSTSLYLTSPQTRNMRVPSPKPALCLGLCLDNRAPCEVLQNLRRDREALVWLLGVPCRCQRWGGTARTLMRPQGWRGHPRCALSSKADRPKADLGAPRALLVVVAEIVVTVT